MSKRSSDREKVGGQPEPYTHAPQAHVQLHDLPPTPTYPAPDDHISDWAPTPSGEGMLHRGFDDVSTPSLVSHTQTHRPTRRPPTATTHVPHHSTTRGYQAQGRGGPTSSPGPRQAQAQGQGHQGQAAPEGYYGQMPAWMQEPPGWLREFYTRENEHDRRDSQQLTCTSEKEVCLPANYSRFQLPNKGRQSVVSIGERTTRICQQKTDW